MTELLALVEAESAAKATKSISAKAKISAEEQAALELREAAMRGRVDRQTLADITQLEDSSEREKAGQREKQLKCIYVLIYALPTSELNTAGGLTQRLQFPVIVMWMKTYNLSQNDPALQHKLLGLLWRTTDVWQLNSWQMPERLTSIATRS